MNACARGRGASAETDATEAVFTFFDSATPLGETARACVAAVASSLIISREL